MCIPLPCCLLVSFLGRQMLNPRGKGESSYSLKRNGRPDKKGKFLLLKVTHALRTQGPEAPELELNSLPPP